MESVFLADRIARLEARVVELENGRCGAKEPPVDMLIHEYQWWFCDRCELYHLYEPPRYVVKPSPAGETVERL